MKWTVTCINWGSIAFVLLWKCTREFCYCIFFPIVFFNEWPSHGATLKVHKYTTVSVKIAGTLYCLPHLLMLVYKIWWVKRDKQHSEDQWRRARSKKKELSIKVSELFLSETVYAIILHFFSRTWVCSFIYSNQLFVRYLRKMHYKEGAADGTKLRSWNRQEVNVSIARSVPRVRASSHSAAHGSLLTSVWSVFIVKKARVTRTSMIYHHVSHAQSVTQMRKPSVLAQRRKMQNAGNVIVGE